jgi:hypothetical protein
VLERPVYGFAGIGHCYAFLALVRQTKVQPETGGAGPGKQKRLSTSVGQALAGIARRVRYFFAMARM